MFSRASVALGNALCLVILVLFTVPTAAQFRKQSPWGWSCVNQTCIKQDNNALQKPLDLYTCKLTCGRDGVLWPRPTGLVHIGVETVHFLSESLALRNVTALTDEVKDLIKKAFDIFKSNVDQIVPDGAGRPITMGPFRKKVTDHRVVVDVWVSGTATRLTLETPEDYTLSINTRGTLTVAKILATNFFGARHALETLSQLIEYDEVTSVLQMVSTAAITDSPVFRYRGILLDTSRNFFSVRAIERTLDAMAANKLNTFHWHITDSQSFPMYLDSLPKMAFYGAYSSRQVYRPADIRHLVEYGRLRGIRVLPELDTPAHVGNGWQWTEKHGLGKVAVCFNQEPWQSYCEEPPCGQLNVANNNSYTILAQIYKEMVDLFGPLDLFHFGGDQVNLNCWNETEDIQAHLEKKGVGLGADSFYQLWGDFHASAYSLLSEANAGRQVPGVVWTSDLTQEERVDRHLNPENYIIQVWTSGRDQTIGHLLRKGYRLILSNHDAWYLDCGFGHPFSHEESWCGSYKGWQAVYDNSPVNIAVNLTGSPHSELLLGGEAALWSEQADEANIDSKLWPRGSALAERLWTNPRTNWERATTRLIHHRQRMVRRGVMAERIQPQWCHQNEGLCYL